MPLLVLAGLTHMPVWAGWQLIEDSLSSHLEQFSFDHISDPVLVSPAESRVCYKQDIGARTDKLQYTCTFQASECIMFTQLPSSETSHMGLGHVYQNRYTLESYTASTWLWGCGGMNRSTSATTASDYPALFWYYSRHCRRSKLI